MLSSIVGVVCCEGGERVTSKTPAAKKGLARDLSGTNSPHHLDYPEPDLDFFA
jgi:hypothetical protein